MALIIEDGSIVTNANSYISAQEFLDWMDARGYQCEHSESHIEEHILKAMDYIESLNFMGIKYTREQPLQFPRDRLFIDGYSVEANEIPKELKEALYNATKADHDGDLATQPVERQTVKEKIGDIEVEYKSNSSMRRQTPGLSNALRKLVIPATMVSRA
jgi:hypothetical protein